MSALMGRLRDAAPDVSASPNIRRARANVYQDRSILENRIMATAADPKATLPARGRNALVPALALVVLSPLVAEVLPGATRLSSLFVFPIEMCVWGGGTLLIRHAVRKWRLGWLNMLCLALALAVAEECLIQQTSLAPMVLQLKGQEYARAFGVNYVYFLWALVYETVFVVFLAIHLAELIFADRAAEPWVNRAGLFLTSILFAIGGFLAWLSWTQFARPHAFHVPVYNPPPGAMATAAAVLAGLVFLALGPFRQVLARDWPARKPPAPWLLAMAGGLWATLWYGLVLLGFGIAPWFPPFWAVTGGMLLVVLILVWLPRWVADSRWSVRHQFALIFGTMLGSMLVSFIGFIGSAPADLLFKVIVNLIAVGLLIRLGRARGALPSTRSKLISPV